MTRFLPIAAFLFSVYSVALSSVLAQKIETAKAERQQVIRVETSMEHLTVTEMSEPVTMVAAGSPAFKIERRENKVFIQPLEEYQSTNLFIWTLNNRYSYELVPAGSVEKMHFAIDQAKPETLESEAKDLPASSPNLNEMLTRTLADSREIRNFAVKKSDAGVSVTVKEILLLEGHLLVRYVIRNNSRRSYHPLSPQVSWLVSPKASVSLHALGNSQVDAKASGLKYVNRVALGVFGFHLQSEVVEPGQQVPGMVEIEPALSHEGPIILELSFASDRKSPLVATLVL